MEVVKSGESSCDLVVEEGVLACGVVVGPTMVDNAVMGSPVGEVVFPEGRYDVYLSLE